MKIASDHRSMIRVTSDLFMSIWGVYLLLRLKSKSLFDFPFLLFQEKFQKKDIRYLCCLSKSVRTLRPTIH